MKWPVSGNHRPDAMAEGVPLNAWTNPEDTTDPATFESHVLVTTDLEDRSEVRSAAFTGGTVKISRPV